MEHKALLTALLGQLTGKDLRDYFVMFGFVALFTLLGSWLLTRSLSVNKPGLGQQILELVVSTLRNMLTDNIAHHGEKYLPWVGPFAVFIFFANLLGVIPWFQPPTQYWIVTIALGVCSFLVYTYLGIRATKFHYVGHFIGPMIPIGRFNLPLLILLFIPIELLSHLARPFSLSIRLFANIMGEHQVSGVFLHLVPIFVPAVFMIMGLFTIVLQTFVFVTLSIVYIALAVEHH